MKFLLLALSLVVSAVLSVNLVKAAAPDGIGSWADEITSSTQGLMKNGLAVPAVRSDPSSALGVAENTISDGTFFSLGLGGQISLRFDNGVRGGVIVVESTHPNYPSETARVEVSADNSSWTLAGNLSQTGQVSMPEGINCVNYVRITDTSDPNQFPDDIADGYDVDGVQAINGDLCATPNPTPTSSTNPTPTSSSSSSSAPVCTDTKPATPTLLSVVRNSPTTAVLTWTTVSPASHYTISYGTVPGVYLYGVPNTGNTNTFSVGGLSAGTNYYFVVRAVNGCAPGDPSGENGGSGQVLGASTGQVLGASTDRLAATGFWAWLNYWL